MINILINILSYVLAFFIYSYIMKKITEIKIKKIQDKESEKAEDSISQYFDNYDKDKE